MTRVDSPIRIGKYTLKNRITFAPTVKFDYTDDSALATEKHIEHYKERAEGGCALICVEATAVKPEGRFYRNHMGLWNDEQAESHKPIVQACHNAGAVVIIQLNHAGYLANPELGPAKGPSSIECRRGNVTYQTVEMSIEEIHAMQKAYVDAAIRAQNAGYNGVQLHGCHGYLINQFASPDNNRRTDMYGGSVKNRARFATEIIEEIRRKCGDDFLISVRTTGKDDTVEAAIEVAEEYVKSGCDYLQVSFGMSSVDDLTHPDEKLVGIHIAGAEFKKHFDGRVPVSCVWNLLTPERVKYIIENEYWDTVDLARAVLADPGFANAVINNTDYTACYECKGCQYGPNMKHVCPAERKRNRNK